MNNRLAQRNRRRIKRALRVRKRLKAAGHPRLSVIKSNCNIFVQLINDNDGKIMASTSTVSKEFQGTEFAKKNKASARKLGETMAAKMKDLEVSEVTFDRGHAKFHGILAEVASGLRENGVKL